MAFDLSWLWELLNRIVSTMQAWFTSLWTVTQNITNTGQGVFSGLVAFGSQLWDAFIKGVDTLGKWLYDTFKWFYDGLVYVANTFGQWVNTAFSWIGSGVSWLAQQLYNFGNWIYNTLKYVYEWLTYTVVAIWNNIVTWFSGIATAIGTWWGSVISGINTWFTNLLKMFRQKIITTIEADLTISMAWKGAERFLSPQKLSDFGYGLAGIIASPIIGRLVGVIVDAVVPLPSTSSYPLIPDISGFTYTPPTLTVTPPTEPTPPEMGYAEQPIPQPPPIVTEKGLPLDVNVTVGLSVDVTYMSTDRTANIQLTYETVVT